LVAFKKNISYIVVHYLSQITAIMFNTFLPTTIRALSLIEQINIVTILTITGFVFLVLLLLGIIKYFKLKAEHKRLSRTSNLQSEDDNKVYKNFTEGHLYDSF